ncbi:MAG: hypothetical protein AMS15_07710 [Planctomycetes bacterium DG_23]|nr:MAG: hypothetical protein AMS15_07710 [Planctomycetes bacterium DG_23]
MHEKGPIQRSKNSRNDTRSSNTEGKTRTSLGIAKYGYSCEYRYKKNDDPNKRMFFGQETFKGIVSTEKKIAYFLRETAAFFAYRHTSTTGGQD